MVIGVSAPGPIQKGVLGLILVTERPLFSVIPVICIGACPMFFTLTVATFVPAGASTLSIKRKPPLNIVFPNVEQTWIDCCSGRITMKQFWAVVGVMYVVSVSWVLSEKVATVVTG